MTLRVGITRRPRGTAPGARRGLFMKRCRRELPALYVPTAICARRGPASHRWHRRCLSRHGSKPDGRNRFRGFGAQHESRAQRT
jgi:hypothetical protein